MKNSALANRKIGQITSKDNNSSGVADAIEKFILDKK